MASVEDRLTAVEQKLQTLEQADIGAGLRAQAYGLSLVHAEVAEVKAIQAEMREEAATKSDVAELKDGLAEVQVTLARIAARLSDPPER